VAASLRPDLVLQEAAGGPGGDQLDDGAVGVQRVAVAGVGVDDDRDRHAQADPPGTVDHLGLGQQAEVGLADGGGGDRVAGDERHREAGPVGELRREGVEDAGEGDGADLGQDAVDARAAHDEPRTDDRCQLPDADGAIPEGSI
jgi:hypothetical protein